MRRPLEESQEQALTTSHRYLPAIGRFLIVVTFLEDALRILTQWTDQLVYLRDFRHSTLHKFASYVGLQEYLPNIVPWGITHLFLIFNVIAMTTCSTLVIIRKYSEYAVCGLLAVVVTQALGYGLIFDLNFFLRNLSVMGGLLMVLSDSWVRKRGGFAGLPSIDERDRKKYIQLAGRVLLIFLFIGFVFSGEWTFGRIIVSLFGLVACVMVAIGFKAKISAVMLVMLLSVFNVLVNNFWTVSWMKYGMLLWHLANSSAAASASPTQGLRQIRLFPNPLYRRGLVAFGEYGSRTNKRRREEEGVLIEWILRVMKTREVQDLEDTYEVGWQNERHLEIQCIKSKAAYLGVFCLGLSVASRYHGWRCGDEMTGLAGERLDLMSTRSM